MMSRRGRLLLIAPLALLGMVVFTAVGGLVVRWLWNWLLPPLFGWPTLGFWQALGLLALCRILFGGFGLRARGPDFRRRMMERWQRMTPEERERFRHGMRGHGFGPPPTGENPAP